MSADVSDEKTYAVLTAILLKKVSDASALSEATGLPLDDTGRILGELEKRQAVFSMNSSVMATESGTALVKEIAARNYGELRGDPELERWHARFEPLNRQFLSAVTAWQTVDVGGTKLSNDHSDSEYDDKVRSRLDGLVNKMSHLLEEIGAKVPRLLRYRDRLNSALDKSYAGDSRFISDVRVDSLHTVWFEMHEDVLLVLGKERTDAGG